MTGDVRSRFLIESSHISSASFARDGGASKAMTVGCKPTNQTFMISIFRELLSKGVAGDQVLIFVNTPVSCFDVSVIQSYLAITRVEGGRILKQKTAL